jgi:hypothetical protein
MRIKKINNLLNNHSLVNHTGNKYTSHCLTDKEIIAIYHERITHKEKERIYSHLEKCAGCRSDVKIYFEHFE